MDRNTRSRLELAITTPDAISAWNEVVRKHKLYFRLSYLSHYPTLLAGVGGETYLPITVIHTRTKKIQNHEHLDPAVTAALDDLTAALKEHGMKFSVAYSMKSQQKFVSLHLQSITGGPMTIVLDRIKKGTTREYHDFKLTDRW